MGQTTSNFVNPGDSFAEKPLGGDRFEVGPNKPFPGNYWYSIDPGAAGKPIVDLSLNVPAKKLDPGSNDFNDQSRTAWGIITDPKDGTNWALNPDVGFFQLRNLDGSPNKSTALDTGEKYLADIANQNAGAVDPAKPDINALPKSWGKKPVGFVWKKKF